MYFDDVEPFPEESAFVASYRESIPSGRVTTATTSGMAILRGRGRGARGTGTRASGTGTRARAAGTRGTRLGTTSRRRRAEEPDTSNYVVEQTITGRGRGRAEWLLWGEGQSGTAAEGQAADVDVDASQAPPVDNSQA